MFNLEKVLIELSRKRPVFHSEADFQHSLAWQIHTMHPNLNIRLEKREEINGEYFYFDIFISKNDIVFIVELKYKTKSFVAVVSNEHYHLKNQSAHDCGRYDFCKDIERLERVSKKYPRATGFAIFLTNDASYWKIPTNKNTVDKDFRIHEGRTISGTLRWKEEASEGTKKGREKPIQLTGRYKINWRDFSVLKEKNGKFRYLCVRVKSNLTYFHPFIS